MKREEQILNESIDYSFIEDNYIEYDDCGDVCDDKDFIQKAFMDGAKWADKTMIEKACSILEDMTEGRLGKSFISEFKNKLKYGVLERH